MMIERKAVCLKRTDLAPKVAQGDARSGGAGVSRHPMVRHPRVSEIKKYKYMRHPRHPRHPYPETLDFPCF